jgi:hypothetical protein
MRLERDEGRGGGSQSEPASAAEIRAMLENAASWK